MSTRLAKAVIDHELAASKPQELEHLSTESLWQLAQSLEALAIRSEAKGCEASTLRRVAVRVGEIALSRR